MTAQEELDPDEIAKLIEQQQAFRRLDASLGISPLWEQGVFGFGVTVAVLDTGINVDCPFSSQVSARYDQQCRPTSEEPSSPHGTNIAACINLVAPKADLLSFSVFPGDTVPGLLFNRMVRDAVANALNFCIDSYPRIRIANLSLAVPRGPLFPCSPEHPCKMCAAVNRAADCGILVIVAAGNTGPEEDTIECPGLAKGALTVGATLSQAEDQQAHIDDNASQRYGTSFSAAYVSGGIALILSRYPNATRYQVQQALRATAAPLPDVPSNAQGAGRVGFSRAMDALDALLRKSEDPTRGSVDPEPG
jgi:serine protease AprX